MIRGDEGTIVLETDWSSGVANTTVIPRKGQQQVIKGSYSDTTRAHWKNLLDCVRSRQKPVSDVEFGYNVQVALNMSLLSYLNRKVAKYDFDKEEIIL
jgi:hypothetical protein